MPLPMQQLNRMLAQSYLAHHLSACSARLSPAHLTLNMVAKVSELEGRRDVDIAYFGTILALWSLDVPENMF